MTDYLMPIAGSVPVGFDWQRLTTDVFNNLKTDEAISDLSLPPTSMWGNAVPLVRPVFKLLGDDADRGVSYTQYNHAEQEMQSVVQYTIQEYANCPQLVEQRFCYEITHGLRCSIIQSTFNAHPTAHSEYMRTTPPMAPKKRKFKSSDRIFMHNKDNRFHSGHWMEHWMYGGVAVGLTGSYITDEHNPAGSRVDLQGSVLYFRVVRTSTSRYIAHDGDLYVKTTGYMYNPEQHVFEDTPTVIFHCSGRTTCGGGH